jgi:hypothetical protein
MAPASETPPLSQLLLELSARSEPDISLAELAEGFGASAIGALLFVFGLVCMLPLPPGSTTVFGLPLVLMAPQLALGAKAPWLPRRVRHRRVPVADLRPSLTKAARWVHRMEAVSRPRLHVLLSPLGQRVVGVVCTILALVLILPIPLGNLLPAAAVTVLSFSLIQRDGVIALIGHGLAVASAGVLVIAAHIVVRAIQHLGDALTAA